MKKIRYHLLINLLFFTVWNMHSQGIETQEHHGSTLLQYDSSAFHHAGNLGSQINCISQEQYAIINAQVTANIQMLQQNGALAQDQPEMVVSFNWPLRLKSGLTDPSYYIITNYVDENFGVGVQDYNCGSRTYNTHRGTDIGTWPFGWNKMANNEVEVIAAASGTIVLRQDGYFDQNCTLSNMEGNGIIVQHSDGSRAWYWHMKKNSVTSKGVGSTVVAGEYLGVVGSSGYSTGPHLHFEVDLGNSQPLIDPWVGNCNYGQSWWSSQKPYYDPKICKVMSHNNEPSESQCPSGENMYASNTFQPGQLAYFAGYFRDYQPQTNATYQVKRPDGTIWKTWTVQNVNNYLNQAAWYFSSYLPSNAPNGTWTFTVTVYSGVSDPLIPEV